MVYRGVQSYGKVPACHDYASAQVSLDAYKSSDHKVFSVYSWHGQIVFRLYATDIISYRADGTIKLRGYPSVTTSEVARRFLPAAIHMRSDALTCLMGQRDLGDDWRPRWDEAVICGSGVTLTQVGGIWSIDESSLYEEFHFLDLDRIGARKVVKDYPFADFATWLSMAPKHIDVDHEGADTNRCLGHLKRREFLEAAKCMPLIGIPRGFGLSDRMVGYGIKVPGWRELVTRYSHKVMALSDWERMSKRMDTLARAGVNSYGHI